MNNDQMIRKYQRRERKLRASYRRKMFVVCIIALLVGAVGGWFGHSYYNDTNNDVTSLGANSSVATTEPIEWADPNADSALGLLTTATDEPTVEPTEAIASLSLDVEPTEEPTAEPTPEPTAEPTAEPTEEPTPEPTEEPTPEPTEEPTPEPTEEPTPEPTEEPTPEPTAEPTPEPTEEPTPEPTEAPAEPGAKDLPIAVGEPFTFNVEVLADGTPRKTVDETEYFTVPVTLTLTRHMDNAYYEAAYGDAYLLKGNESGCELHIVLGECEGITELMMQNVLEVVLQNAADEVHPGYQFTNAEISGETNSVVKTSSEATIYKRYNFGDVEDLEFMTVSYYVNGEKKTIFFELGEPVVAEPVATPEPTAEPTEEPEADATEAPTEDATPAPVTGESYTIGSKGEEVKRLQAKLIELGYLRGSPDGQFGQWTAGAIKEAQKDFGLDVTGIADPAFLEELYSR